MQKSEAAEVRRRLANDSEGLQPGFSLDGMRGIKQERGFGKRDKLCPGQKKDESFVTVVVVSLASQPVHHSPRPGWGQVPHAGSGMSESPCHNHPQRRQPREDTQRSRAMLVEAGRSLAAFLQLSPGAGRPMIPPRGFGLPTPPVPISLQPLPGSRRPKAPRAAPGWLRLLPAQPLQPGCPVFLLQLTALP